jgi:hypothetical protein
VFASRRTTGESNAPGRVNQIAHPVMTRSLADSHPAQQHPALADHPLQFLKFSQNPVRTRRTRRGCPSRTQQVGQPPGLTLPLRQLLGVSFNSGFAAFVAAGQVEALFNSAVERTVRARCHPCVRLCVLGGQVGEEPAFYMRVRGGVRMLAACRVRVDRPFQRVQGKHMTRADGVASLHIVQYFSRGSWCVCF